MHGKTMRVGVSLAVALVVLTGLLLMVGHTGASVPQDAGKPTRSESIPGGTQREAATKVEPRRPLAQLPSAHGKPGVAEDAALPVSSPAGCSFLACQRQAGIDTIVSVSITENGPHPAVVTITVGSTVVWTNRMEETVHLARLYRVHLPLILNDLDGTVVTSGSAGFTVHGGTRPSSPTPSTEGSPTAAGQAYDWGNVDLAPGESYSHTFTLVDEYSYALEGPLEGEGSVRVEPLKTDERVLMWATGGWVCSCAGAGPAGTLSPGAPRSNPPATTSTGTAPC